MNNAKHFLLSEYLWKYLWKIYGTQFWPKAEILLLWTLEIFVMLARHFHCKRSKIFIMRSPNFCNEKWRYHDDNFRFSCMASQISIILFLFGHKARPLAKVPGVSLLYYKLVEINVMYFHCILIVSSTILFVQNSVAVGTVAWTCHFGTSYEEFRNDFSSIPVIGKNTSVSGLIVWPSKIRHKEKNILRISTWNIASRKWLYTMASKFCSIKVNRFVAQLSPCWKRS